MRYLLAVLLLLVSSVASAQVYKCTHDGHVAYQDTPCAGGDQGTQVREGVVSVDALVGCYNVTPPARNGANPNFMIEVRTSDAGYQLRAIGSGWDANLSLFSLHRANRHALDKVGETAHLRLRAGLSVQWNPDVDPVPLGLYMGEDAQGRTQYVLFFRNTWGPAQRMACP